MGHGKNRIRKEKKANQPSLGWEPDLKLHDLFFGKRLVDPDGAPIVDIKRREFQTVPTEDEPKKVGTLIAFTISAALVDGRGYRKQKQFGPDDSTYDQVSQSLLCFLMMKSILPFVLLCLVALPLFAWLTVVMRRL